ncbi:MAG: helix-turn-helix domain-containing protein [Renibacterium sp.]|nr:helix-turn-helix domain-containing protein [Renibacterium sp.]
MSPATAVRSDLSVKQVADDLGIHRVNACELIRRGYFPNAYKSGQGKTNSPWRVPVGDLVDYKARQPGPEVKR